MTINLRERILRRLESGPLGQSIIAEAQAEELAERRRLQSAILKRRGDFKRERQPLQAKAEASVAAYKAALETLRVRQNEMEVAAVAGRNATYRFDRDVLALERDLAALAPAEMIDAFVDEMSQRAAAMRRGPLWETVVGPRMLGGRPKWVVSNRESFEATLRATDEAGRAARALATDLEVEDFAAALNAIRASIPEVEPVRLSKAQQRELGALVEDDEDGEPGGGVYERRGMKSA